MRTFLELKNYSMQQLKKRNLSFKVNNAKFEVYDSSDFCQLYIAFNNGPAVIKFEQSLPEIFCVAVSFGDKQDIIHGKSEKFEMDDNLTRLIDVFPDGYLIDEVLSVLLSIKTTE